MMLLKSRFQSKKTKKTIIVYLVCILILGAFGCIALQSFIENKIKKTLSEDLPPTIQLAYENLDFSLLSKNIALKNIQAVFIESSDTIAIATIKNLCIRNISYGKILWDGNLEVDNFIIDSLNTTYYVNKEVKEKSPNKRKKQFKKTIRIENVEIKNSNFESKIIRTDSTVSKIDDINISLKDCKINKETLASKIPFVYDSYTIESGKVFFNSSKYEAIKIGSLHIDKNASIHGFSLKTKYDRKEFEKKLHKERDYIDLKIPDIEIEGLDFNFQKDSLCVEIISGKFKKLDLAMYRNKLLPDDLVRKPMFLETLYNMPLKITIPEIKLEDGSISYSELVKENTKAGEIFFTDINSTITNLSNTNDKEIVFVNKAKLMGTSPIDLEWSFYKKEKHNLFRAYGVIKDFDTKNINSFLKSNLRAEARGTISELYFTISGDDYTASGDMKMKYTDFGFVVLKKDRLGVNKLLTAIGNIFTNDGSKTDENGYRYGEIKVERNPTKSFFNYLWINVKDGILSTFTSNGKKK